MTAQDAPRAAEPSAIERTVVPRGSSPEWASLVDADGWSWRGGTLVRDGFDPPEGSQGGPLRRLVVSQVYATQNRSGAVRRAVARCLAALDSESWGLNLGSGATRLHPRMINLDAAAIPEADIVAPASPLPFRSGSLRLVVAQELLEHTPDPFAVRDEVLRVLEPGGLFYLQVPFQIGWHSGPRDYWRFSEDGVRELVAGPAWEVVEVGPSLGYGSGLYRLAVEYAAITASVVASPLYLPVKTVAAFVLIPLRWVDGLTRFSPQGRRIAGGFYAIARKRGASDGR